MFKQKHRGSILFILLVMLFIGAVLYGLNTLFLGSADIIKVNNLKTELEYIKTQIYRELDCEKTLNHSPNGSNLNCNQRTYELRNFLNTSLYGANNTSKWTLSGTCRNNRLRISSRYNSSDSRLSSQFSKNDIFDGNSRFCRHHFTDDEPDGIFDCHVKNIEVSFSNPSETIRCSEPFFRLDCGTSTPTTEVQQTGNILINHRYVNNSGCRADGLTSGHTAGVKIRCCKAKQFEDKYSFFQ